MHILLAEDDTNISKIACLALEKIGGHSVDLATDGEQALTKALSGTYDVILLDEMMPKLNGLKVCERYLEQVQNPIPVIFLSAKSQESDVQDFLKQGIGHIAKPFNPMTLSQSILDLIKANAA